PTGADPKIAFSKGFIDVAMGLNPKPKSLAIIGADAEFPKNAIDGIRVNAKAAGLNVVYDKTYPPPTTDFTPIVRAIQATNGDDDKKLADHIRKTTFKTIVGDIKYGKDGEWEKPRVLMVQYRNIKGSDLDQFRTVAHEAVLDPSEYKTGDVMAPFTPE